MEVVDIDLDDIPLSETTASMPAESSGPSVSFGGGIELLMNEKKKSASSSTKIDLEELDNLESELNNLSQPGPSFNLGGSVGGGMFGGFGGFGGGPVRWLFTLLIKLIAFISNQSILSGLSHSLVLCL